MGGMIFPPLLFPPPYKVSSCHTFIPWEQQFSGGRNCTLPPVTGACQNPVMTTQVIQEVRSRTRRARSARLLRLAAGRGWRAPGAPRCWPSTGSSSDGVCKGKNQNKIWELGYRAGWCPAHLPTDQDWVLAKCTRFQTELELASTQMAMQTRLSTQMCLSVQMYARIESDKDTQVFGGGSVMTESVKPRSLGKPSPGNHSPPLVIPEHSNDPISSTRWTLPTMETLRGHGMLQTDLNIRINPK